MEEAINITRSDLEQALRAWEAESTAGEWPERSDDERFRDNADYLFAKLKN